MDQHKPTQQSKPNTYPIRSLEDIYNLPVSIEKMIECLEELSVFLIQARQSNDKLIELAKLTGIPEDKIPYRAVQLPDVIEWIDDDRGEVKMTYTVDDSPIAQTTTNVRNGSMKSDMVPPTGRPE